MPCIEWRMIMPYDQPPRVSEQRIIRKEWDAWQVCEACKGSGKHRTGTFGNAPLHSPCPKCQGAGGWWHEKVTQSPWQKARGLGWLNQGGRVTRTSILVQSGEECETCGGKCEVLIRGTHCELKMCVKDHNGITCHPNGEECEYYIKANKRMSDCPDCNGTGINPDTERWEVE